MIRVLQVVGQMSFGGAETRLLQLARSAGCQRFYFDFCVFQDDPGDYDDQIRDLGFRTVKCRLSKNILRFSRCFRDLLRARRYDAIHCHVHQFSGLLLRIAAKEDIPRRIMHLRTVRDAHSNSLYRICYRKLMTTWIQQYSTRIVAVSQAAMQAHMGPRWREDSRTQVIYNGIDVSPFMSPPDRAKTLDELGIPSSQQVIIHVGNFRPAKDHETLIQSMSRIVEQSKDVHLLLVGNGPLSPKIRQLVASKGLQHYVHFAGSRNDVPRLLMASDCFIFPSKWEGLPGAVLEALAAGLPVVASDIPAIREIASESDNVYTVAVGSVDGFTRMLSEILADLNSHRRPTGQIPDRFRFDNYVRKVLCLYR